MLPKYSALGKTKRHRHTIICIINQDSLDLTRPLVGLAASFLSGKPDRASVAGACRRQAAGRAAAGVCSRGKRGLALSRGTQESSSPPSVATGLQEMERWHGEEPAPVPPPLPAVAFPVGSGAGPPAAAALGAARCGRASRPDFHPHARQEEPTYHSIRRNKRVVTNLHVYGISLAESIYIYIKNIKIPSSLGK